MNLGRWQGGRRLLTWSAVLGVAGLVLTLVGGLFDVRRALFSYLVAFAYWLGIVLGVLLVLGSLHASNARWSVVVRRFVENVPAALPIFVPLFVPIALGMKVLYPWMDPSRLDPELQRVVAHKAPYLNGGFFLARAVVYFVIWIGVAYFLRAWSVRQDEGGGPSYTILQRRLGAGSIPFVGLAMTFASFDWMMSLDVRFYSTIYGVYWFAGSFMAAFAVTIIGGFLTRAEPDGFGRLMNVDHYHALGKLLLAFVAFWAYIAFSQFMLIWIANIPEEVPWYMLRIRGGWLWVASFVALFQFLVPFFLLLQRAVTRTPRRLAAVGAWLLFVHWIDIYWLLMPHIHRDGPRPWIFDLTAFVGVGGVAVAFALVRMRATAAVPVRDPYLEDSLRYQPQ